ncbi:efflux RND transporter periplasmic adaptor subunit [Mariniblastus sp.]|nr:efflux RND transporter periplasmic adaptor subunit [Mariniblastus sp.]
MTNNLISNLLAVTALTVCCSTAVGQEYVKAFTEPYRSIEIAASETGILSKLLVEEGDQIEAGGLLAKLNDEVLAASLAVGKQTTESEGATKSAMAELKMQKNRFDKLNGLFQRRHASQTELDRARSQLDIATAKVESVQDDLRIKKFEMKRIEAQLEQRKLRSPIDGVVTEIFKEEGEFVSPTDPTVMKVVQLNPLRIIFSVAQEDVSRLKNDDVVPLVTNGKEFVGKVEFVSPTADAQSGTCRVKIRIENDDLSLASGQACYLKGFDSRTKKTTSHRLTQTSTRRKLSTKQD